MPEPAPTTYWCEHAQLPTGVHPGVRLSVSGGRITSVEPRVKEHAGDVHLGGVVLPGFANGHSHVFHRALRGRTHGDGGNFWTWREHMYAVTERLTPDSYLALARAVFAEMVLSGYTAVGEFHYLHHGPGGRPYADPNAMGRALVQAAAEAGIRLTLLDTLYLAGGLAGDGHVALSPVQQRFGDRSVDGWAARHDLLQDGPGLRIGAAAHSVRAVPREDLAELAKVVGDGPVHAHVSEQVAENVAAAAFYGTTPTELLAESGLLRPTATTIHSTHLVDTDIETMARSGAGVCICSTTERDLADGIGPARALHDHGVPLCVGLGPARHHRPLRRGARRRGGGAGDDQRARTVLAARAGELRRASTATAPWAGSTAAPSSPARWPTWLPCASTASGPSERARTRSSSRPVPAT